MYVDKSGREWSSEAVYKEYACLLGALLDYQLAFEDYSDATGNNLFTTEPFVRLWEFRKNRDAMQERELLTEAREIFDGLKGLVETVGKENFIFYDDGGVEYVWENLNKGDKNKD